MSSRESKSARKIRELQAAQQAAERRRLGVLVAGGVLVLIALFVVVGIWVQSNRVVTVGDSVPPAGVTDKYGIVRGEAAAPVTVKVYEDFQCPFCREFETALSATLTKDIDAGQIKVEYLPIAFLDRASSTDYSSRSLETAACTLDSGGVKQFVALHALLFANQPEEGSAGLSDAELAALAAKVGADEQVIEKCQEADTFSDWVEAATDQASKDGVNATPTYLVDGKSVEFTDAASAPKVLQEAIDAATSTAGGAG